MSRSVWFTCLSALLFGFGGCEQVPPTPAFTARDSSGVRIVEYEGDPMREPPRLRISRVVRVGWRAEDPTFEAEHWPVPGQVKSDGRMAVADYQGNVLYRIQSDGTVSQVGSRGQGPGEYVYLDGVVLKGETIVLQDDANRRLTWFAEDGTVKTERFEKGRDDWVISSLHPDGFLTVPRGHSQRSPMGWLDQAVMVLEPSGRIADTVAVLPFVLLRELDNENPLAFFASAAGFPDGGFAYERNDRPEIVWHDHEGSVRQIVRWQPEKTEATPEDWERYEEWYLGLRSPEITPGSLTRGLEAKREDFGGPMPHFRGLHASDEGSVWVEPYSFDRMPGFADVFGADGVYVGRVDLPERFTIIDVDGPFVLGWEFDRLDVPAIALYRVPSLAP